MIKLIKSDKIDKKQENYDSWKGREYWEREDMWYLPHNNYSAF